MQIRGSLFKLIDVAYDFRLHFGLSSYELHHYEDGAFVDFQVSKIEDVPTLVHLSQGLRISVYANGDTMGVRLYEDL